MIEIGLGLPAKSLYELGEYANQASQYPLDSFSLYGDIGDLSPFVALQSIATALSESRIKQVGIMGVPVGLYHPEVTVNSAKALYESLGDKLYIGLVRGAFMDSIGMDPGRIYDIVQTIDKLRFELGEDFPIFIGGYGEKILQLATNKKVDAVKIGGSASPNLADAVRRRLRSETTLIMGSVSVIDRNRREARKLARLEVAKYLAAVGTLDSTLNEDCRNSLERFNKVYGVDSERAHRMISDELLDCFAVAGTSDDVFQTVANLDGTVDRFEFGTPHGIGKKDEAIKIIGEIAIEFGNEV